MKRPISDQVGSDLANKTSCKLGYITASRPYDADSQTVLLHRGPVATFLESTSNQNGVWLLEIDITIDLVEMHLVRWQPEAGEWEYLGETKGGVL